ncbi:5,6-dimethylbenzimidazole synthase [Robbsia sp. Bb-Pol-6]|uniref:5,6-dimethylbenzimidazole synthase n=1 Tax=Robbsia betulipollinis TaxID=2981849 RepID=A0ABT3ZM94_9BURK|nr:5,6-dimethylbenzimidazole synthase [Robbsia betulipollinis]MCY0387668.1 5,6-dimethylbenzimidazole synthase [Robbsia betulipollinis]
MDPQNAFTPAETAAVYRAIHERRDMRHFVPGTVPPDQLARLIDAAHHAPSVGFMQPWRFVRVTDGDMRRRLHALVEAERRLTAEALGERGDAFMQLKVQGVLDSAEVLVAGLMEGREAHVFGRRTLPEMDLASVACAIQNMWLAARAEGLGLGWVSLFSVADVQRLLGMPEGARPVAILCLGPVERFYDAPMLQTEGWARRQPVERCLAENRWPSAPAETGRATGPEPV